MQVSISVRHGQLAESTQDKLKSKAEKIGRFFDRLMSIEIVVDMQNEQEPAVEILVSAEHKHDFVASDKSGSLLAATDAAVHKSSNNCKSTNKKHNRNTAIPSNETEQPPIRNPRKSRTKT